MSSIIRFDDGSCAKQHEQKQRKYNHTPCPLTSGALFILKQTNKNSNDRLTCRPPDVLPGWFHNQTNADRNGNGCNGNSMTSVCRSGKGRLISLNYLQNIHYVAIADLFSRTTLPIMPLTKPSTTIRHMHDTSRLTP